MKLFKKFGEDINYEDIIQLDGSFLVSHINYGKSPIFNEINGKDISKKLSKNSISNKDKIEDVYECLYLFDGTEINPSNNDRIILWENYWLEYINAFDNLMKVLPNSIVTTYIGRHTVEIGIKYLLLKKTGQIKNDHNLGNLANLFFDVYDIKDDYMKYVDDFCNNFCNNIEGGNSEYFRYPDYKKNRYFAGNNLDIEWISYNLLLIILKLIHFADLDVKFN